MDEVWKDIPEYEDNYKVNALGQIYSKKLEQGKGVKGWFIKNNLTDVE